MLAKSGLALRVPGMASQAADHALALSRGDQVAGLSKGIPSLRLYDDSTGNPTAAGLSQQGAAIERLIMSLDAQAEMPSDPGTALVLNSGRYLTSRAVTLLAVLMLLPTICALLIWLFSSRISGRGALMHLRNLLSFAIPLALVFLLAYALARWGLIPLYHFQVPATPGPATSPKVGPTLILILLGGAVFVISRHFLGYLRPRESRAATEMTRLCVGFVSLIFGLALMLSRSPFLLLPCLALAWTWPLATCFAEPVYSGAFWRHRFLSNAPVLLFGLIVPILLYSYLASGERHRLAAGLVVRDSPDGLRRLRRPRPGGDGVHNVGLPRADGSEAHARDPHRDPGGAGRTEPAGAPAPREAAASRGTTRRPPNHCRPGGSRRDTARRRLSAPATPRSTSSSRTRRRTRRSRPPRSRWRSRTRGRS